MVSLPLDTEWYRSYYVIYAERHMRHFVVGLFVVQWKIDDKANVFDRITYWAAYNSTYMYHTLYLSINIYIYIFGIDILSNQCCTCKESDGNNWPLRSESYLHLNSKLLINPANYVSFSFIYKLSFSWLDKLVFFVWKLRAIEWSHVFFHSHLIVVWSCKSEKWVKVVGTTNSSFVLQNVFLIFMSHNVVHLIK